MTDRFLTPRARLDLIEIADYIGGRSPDAADRLLDRLMAACEMLDRRPALGHARPDLVPLRDDIRFWPVGRYLIVYRGDPAGIQVIRILNAYRDVAALLR